MTLPELRIGQGTDIHQIDASRPLKLGGIHIPDTPGLKGHSDADVLLHAIIDALLGALALGDLGAHFPDTDSAWKDADSRKLTEQAYSLIEERGWRVVNVDSTVLTEQPRLKPYILKMREAVAGLLKTTVDHVSIKATTGEKIGFVGRSEGMMAQAVVLLHRVGK